MEEADNNSEASHDGRGSLAGSANGSDERESSLAAHLLRFLADATVVYPLALPTLMYAEWLQGWWCLGHQPILSIDDPKYIDVPVALHAITFEVALSLPYAAALGIIVNLAYIVVVRQFDRRLARRVVAVVVCWAGTYALLALDPWRVAEWWLD